MLPHLWLLLLPQRMMSAVEEAFWCGLDLKMGEELELGILPLGVQMEDVGQWVWWGLEPELAQEGPPLSALGEEPIEVEGSAEQVQEDGITVKDNAAVD